ncbi:probable inactive receptor kinase At1g48480 [Zingiber officinale]|uniref:probable inactive receptor kinase At1g48480 n=1 Tax=Zingiber officinale TaxID=94328 RepID=UPI001C4B1F95|nr:probable inactive receptor kinase At1g48480 [Zingiber officinale]
MASAPLLLLLSVAVVVASAADLTSDRAALLDFRAALYGATNWWNVSEDSPCSWDGVSCEGGRVTELRLPGSSLNGSIPSRTIGNLTALRALSLRYNHLSGTLPSDFSALVSLRYLYLQNNRLSGDIPSVLFSLPQLVYLDLAANSLAGSIPVGFNNLTALEVLFLEQNRLSGEIPDLLLSSLVQFNVSFNQLNGSIPAWLRGMPASSFIGNSLCGSPLDPCPAEGGGGGSKLSDGAIAVIVIGSVIGFATLLVLIIFLFFRKKKKKGFPEEKEAERSPSASETTLKIGVLDAEASSLPSRPPPPPLPALARPLSGGRTLVFVGNVQRIYDLEDLLRASAEVLGKGTTSTTYKALLETGFVVAVKRLHDASLPEKNFRERLEAIAALDHPNLVSLQAYYYSKDEKLLVYEHIPDGSLSSILHGNKSSGRTPLNWETRLEIALGAARGIEYIHFKGSELSHGNIKSSNIILSKSNQAYVSDAGLNTLYSTPMPSQRSGGYRAPEVTDVRRVSQKADVYSFGVLLMELLNGKPPTQSSNGDECIDLPRRVRSVARENWNSEVLDPELLKFQNVEQEMAELLELAIDCTAPSPHVRPSMSEVAGRIERIHIRSNLGDQQQG